MSFTQVTLPVACSPVGGFTYDGTIRALFTETLEDPQSISREELDYAIDTTDLFCLVGIDGWEIESEIVVDPPWGLFDSQRLGSTRMRGNRANLMYAADKLGQDIRLILQRGVRGWIMLLPSGDLPGAPMNVYPVQVAKVIQLERLRNNGAQIEVQFAVTSRPHEDVLVPPFIETVQATWDGVGMTWNGEEVTWN